MLSRLSYNNIFLIDGIGAILTALLLSQVLANFEGVFGMPKKVLFVLAAIAVCFAIYSLACHFALKEKRKPYLLAIAVANSLYCITTLALVFYLIDTLTLLGIAYFAGEIIIVMSLVWIELKITRLSSFI